MGTSRAGGSCARSSITVSMLTKGQKLFDGVMAHVAGAGRGSFNIRFGQPSRDGHPFLNLFYPTDIFRSRMKETDPDTRIKDGLLMKAEQARVTPRFSTPTLPTNIGDGPRRSSTPRPMARKTLRFRPALGSTSSPAASTDRLPSLQCGPSQKTCRIRMRIHGRCGRCL